MKNKDENKIDVKKYVRENIDNIAENMVDYFEENNIPYHINSDGVAIIDEGNDQCVFFHCNNCKKEIILPLEIYKELLEEAKSSNHLEIKCPSCSKGIMKPSDLYK